MNVKGKVGGYDFRSYLARSQSMFLVLLFVLAACTGLPSAQLATYLSVSEEAEKAGQGIYGALNTVVQFNKQPNSGSGGAACAPSNANPTCFDPTDYLTSAATVDPDIRARMLALETVAAYNDTLVALNSGQSGAALNEKIDSYGAVASSFASIASVATGGVSLLLAEPTINATGTIAGNLETARAQFKTRQSLSAQKDVVKALIGALIQDTPKVYELYRTNQLVYARNRPGGPRGAEGQREFAKIKAMHDSLGAYVVLLSNTSDSLDILVEAADADARDPDTLNAALGQALEVKNAAQLLEKNIRLLLD